MTSTTAISHPSGLRSDIEPLDGKWGWLVALGIVYVIAGLVALGSVVAATVATVLVVGIMMLIAGGAEVIRAFQVETWGKRLLSLLLGVLYVIAGIATFENPVLAAVWLTLVLGAALMVAGIMRIFAGMSLYQGAPRVGIALSGGITLLLGLIVLAHWPISSVYVLGLFLGIDLVMAGAGWILVGFGRKKSV